MRVDDASRAVLARVGWGLRPPHTTRLPRVHLRRDMRNRAVAGGCRRTSAAPRGQTVQPVPTRIRKSKVDPAPQVSVEKFVRRGR